MAKLLYVGNLSLQTTEQDLEELFSQAGNVESARVMRHTNTGDSKGFGFVEMSNDQEAASAIAQFNGKELHRKKLQVNEARNQ
jgi:RNA recognition motif-containing protein